ncbi:MAG: hypothetical protein GXO49_07595 [Chlorobi bacterium]|nr:hypothetical protein [Chlorobiota bacterium]
MKVKTALISVSDKTGIVDFVKKLKELGLEKILSSGGTARVLAENGIDVTEVSEYTGFPEMLDGRVKTLHPKIHGGILAMRDKKEHMNKLKEFEILPIDLVVVNLYPFLKTIEKPDCTFEDAIENIDIGGPTLIRAAAKNFKDVIVITDPIDYNVVIEQLSTKGDVDYKTRLMLAQKVFSLMSNYDGAIANYLNKFC